jgi:ubiquitin carboxyl-terminal hydrolase 14
MSVESAAPAAAAAAARADAAEAARGYNLPAGFLGYYTLFALVTHKGRSADSGHYIAWVRRSMTGRRDPADAGKWLVFDDDTVGEVDTEYVMSHLKGGGDDHTNYLALYQARTGT